MDYVSDFGEFEFNIKGGIYANDCDIGTNIHESNNTTLIRNAKREGNESLPRRSKPDVHQRVTNTKIRFGYQ